jgi:hypothetical protein
LSISLAILASGDICSSSLSEMSILIGIEDNNARSAPAVDAESFFFCSSMETGGDGGRRLAGCCTFATNVGGELRSNCCTVLLWPNVKRVAPGP